MTARLWAALALCGALSACNDMTSGYYSRPLPTEAGSGPIVPCDLPKVAARVAREQGATITRSYAISADACRKMGGHVVK